jgi:DNA repair photolyase
MAEPQSFVQNVITQIEVRSVLTPQNHRSSLPCDYTINPFRGCLFGCKYCYASKFIHDDADKKADWGRWVEIKRNAVDALQRESHKLQGKTVFFSSATDPYQPVEKRLGLTRALLEILLASFPAHVHIQTRSPHVIRDIDVFQRFGDTLTVGISVPTDSEVVRKVFEPRAPSIPRRLKAAKQLKEAGIRTTAAVAPLLPCTPARLAVLLTPCFDSAWVGQLNFYDRAGPLRALYASRGWEKYLHRDHAQNVRSALRAVDLSSEK